ncbi:MAG: phosphocarrier protein HPr [Gammaproteobacteria bacterium]|jgi:phosphocarrier protein|nr:phosphocarrier protein HPr [Gammaproteobacteria bacterium]MBC8476147.1 HPr family phosphocarrier protein [Gammaproteobacteria bacterium]
MKPMLNRFVTITNRRGLHARSASVLAKTASKFQSDIRITNQYAKANGKNIMSLLLLQASFHSKINVQVSGEDEVLAMKTIVCLVENRFGEEE